MTNLNFRRVASLFRALRSARAPVAGAALAALVALLACDDDAATIPLGGDAAAGATGAADAGPGSSDAATASDAVASDTGAGDVVGPGDTLADGSPDAGPGDAAAPGDGLPLAACEVPRDATITATLRVTADDHVRIWFNGALVAEPQTLWSALKQYDVAVFLHGGRRNVIAVEARNQWKQNGLDRGFIAELAYQVGDTTYYVNSDPTWKVGTTEVEGWTALDFDDGAWANPVSLGRSGIPPWGRVAFNTEAEWLWAYRPDAPASEKVDVERNWFRKVFFMNAAGRATDTQPCR